MNAASYVYKIDMGGGETNRVIHTSRVEFEDVQAGLLSAYLPQNSKGHKEATGFIGRGENGRRKDLI